MALSREQQKAMFAKQIKELEQRKERFEENRTALSLMPLPKEAFIEGFTNKDALVSLNNDINKLDFRILQLKEKKESIRSPEEQKSFDESGRKAEEILRELIKE